MHEVENDENGEEEEVVDREEQRQDLQGRVVLEGN